MTAITRSGLPPSLSPLDADTARALLVAKLKDHGLTPTQFTMIEIDTNTAQAIVLNDGDY